MKDKRKYDNMDYSGLVPDVTDCLANAHKEPVPKIGVITEGLLVGATEWIKRGQEILT